MVVSNVTTSGFTLDWTVGSNESEWSIDYGITGHIPGFGNTITVSNKLKEVSVKVGPFGPPT